MLLRILVIVDRELRSLQLEALCLYQLAADGLRVRTS